MERPIRFEHHRCLGDKRTQVVYDLDTFTDAEVIDELMAAETYLCFGPDTLRRGPQPRLPARAGPPRRRPTRVATPAVEHRFPSSGNLLAAHLARPPMRADVTACPAVVLAHGYPSDVSATAVAASALPELADRIAAEMGWLAMALAFRGLRRLRGQLLARRLARRPRAPRSTTCATTSRSAACGWPGSAPAARWPSARPPPTRRSAGVAALGAPADFDDWASHPKRLLEHAREVGHDRASPPSRPTSTPGPASSGSCGRSSCARARAPPAAGRARQRRRPRPRVRRPGPRRRPRRRRAPHHERRRPPAPPRSPRGGRAPRLARPPEGSGGRSPAAGAARRRDRSNRRGPARRASAGRKAR